MLLILIAAILLLQIPAVQTGIAKRALASLDEKIGGKIQVGSLRIEPFNTIIVTDALLTDDNRTGGQDTVFFARNVTAKFSLKGLFNKENPFNIKSLSVSDGLFALITDADGKSNLTHIFGETENPEPPKLNFEASINNVNISNFRFKMMNLNPDLPEYCGQGMNWADLDLTANLRAKNLKVHEGIIHGTLEHLSAQDKCGYTIQDLSAEARIGDALAEITDIKMKDRWSDVSVPRFSMSGPLSDYAQFTDKIKLDMQVGRSHLDFKTLAGFAGSLESMPLTLDIVSAKGRGPINNLVFDNATVTESSGVRTSLSGRIAGLTGPEDISVGFDVKNVDFNMAQLQALLEKVLGKNAPDLRKYGGGETFKLTAKGSGKLSDLNADVSLSSGSGLLNAICNLSGLSGNSPVKIRANVNAHDLDIGKLIGIDEVHQLTLHTNASASLGKGTPHITIDTLAISRLNALGYDYTDIAGAGELADNAFNGKIVCGDPNLHFLFQGLLSLAPQDQNALYKFYLNLGYADLNALNIDKRGTSKASMVLNANYMRIPEGDLIGTADVSNLFLENDYGQYDIGDISISSQSARDLYRINLKSGFADATYLSNRSISKLPAALMEVVGKKALPAFFDKPSEEWDSAHYNIDVDIHKAYDLLSFVMPGLYIAEGSTIDLDINQDGIMNASVVSQRLAFEDKYVKDVSLTLNNLDDMVSGQFTSNEASIGSFALNNTAITIGMADNTLDTRLSYHNPGETLSGGELGFLGTFSRDEDGKLAIEATTQPSIISEGGTDWRIMPADISFNNGDIKIGSLVIDGEDQFLTLDGGISKTRPDTLILGLDSFNLGIIGQLLNGAMDIGGRATGQAVLTSPLEGEMGLIMSIVTDSTTLNGVPLGELELASNWNDETSSIEATLVSKLDGANPIDVHGSYTPSSKNLSAQAVLDGFNLAYFDGIAPDVFSEMSGRVHGTINLSGTPDNLSISGEDTFLNGVRLRVAYTNVPYMLTGPFEVSDTGITFNDVTLRDTGNGTGRVRGGLYYDKLKDLRMNMRFILDNIQAFNTTFSQDSPVYGQLYASGNVRITGPFDHLTLSVDATTGRTGRFHVALGNASSQNNTKLLVFKEVKEDVWVDPYERFYRNYEHVQNTSTKSGSLDVRLNVNVTPETELMLELDKEASSTITCTGQGSTAIDVRDNTFTINGDYTINNGLCHLGLLDVATRDFNIKDGSSIKFNGDVMDSDLDINAVYTTKASLSGLIADTTSVGSRRTVECTLNIYDKLRNPQLAFAIDIPDIDPITRASVESALNTEDKVQKQFVALLVGNSFIPDEQSGIVNTSSMLYSNVAGIMANQLSNVLQQLNIPLDLGLKYQPNEGGKDIFDVAISTELFNNRVVVNGAIGNRMYQSNSSSDLVGDLDIEVKLNRSGALRLTLFSHSVDQYTNYLDDSQRNGIGMAYQKEFTTFKELWNSIFQSKKKKAAEAVDEQEEEKVIFNIE